MIASCLKNVVLFWCKRQVAAVPNKPKLVSSVNIYPPVHYVLMFLCQFKFLSLGQSRCHFLSTWFIIIPPLPEGGGGYTVLPLSVHPSKIFFVTFFSVTVDGRNLIFGHKLDIGMPYRVKRFWNHQIPTSCLPN